MKITLGQQYNVGEKPTVILYTYINRHAGTPEKTVKTKQGQCSTLSHMVVIIYYYMGYEYKATFSLFFFNLTYSRWTSSLLSCLWSQRIFPSLPNTKPLHGMKPGSPMVVTMGQQYNVGEKPTVILYTCINKHAETPKHTKT